MNLMMIYKEDVMRDCDNCIHRKADGCEVWECEYINRYEAIEAYETLKVMKEMEKARIDQYGYIPKGE